MRIKKIDFNSEEFRKVMKDAPKKLILFNEKADYYCALIDGEIASICGIVKDRTGYKIVTSFTYEKYRGSHVMYKIVKYILSKYKSDVYYVNSNEKSTRIFERIGFKGVYTKRFKNFKRIAMILKE